VAGTAAPLRVGVVGATPARGWGTAAHLPALRALPEFELTAVATTRAQTAEATATAFGVAHAFTDDAALIASPEVDVVAITVKVPEHAALVRAALAANKHVFCEWPLARDLAEASALADLAAASGVRHVVGLQGYHAPGARYVRELVEQGFVGELLAVSAVTGGGPGGIRIPQANVYATDRAAGATVLSISTGHLLAALGRALGLPRTLTGVVASVNRSATVIETGAVVPVTSPDQVAAAGLLAGGVPISVAVQGGAAPGAARFELRVIGTEATLVARPDRAGGAIHVGEWAITAFRGDGPGEDLPVPARLAAIPADVPAGPPRNVALLYRELARAISEDRPAEPDFLAAVTYHRLLAAIQASSDTGTRQDLASGPVPGDGPDR
jgi:predicted dehydrogenase